MRDFWNTKWGKVCAVAIAILALAAAGMGAHASWYVQQPKFQGATIELGSAMPKTETFMTEHAKPQKVRWITTAEEIDLSHVGDQELVLQHGRKQETVTLTIVDTTAPAVVFQDVHADLGEVLLAQDFVAEVSDLSAYTVAFVQSPGQPESYGNVQAQLVVTDAYGNTTTGTSQIYYVWMKSSYTLELGDKLEKADVLMDPEKDADLLDQRMLDRVNLSGVGEYTLISSEDDLLCRCQVTVQDTTAPVLKLQEVQIYQDGAVSKGSFIESVYDASGEVTTELLTKLDKHTYGTQTVEIRATDMNGNVTTGKTKLKVVKDTTPPTFSGTNTMQVEKNSKPNYKSGVSAYDGKDGRVSFTYDDSKVDLTKAGTYYVVYSATDKAGNTATHKRKVEVAHDAEDTTALVNSIAETLPSDPEAIRDYVRNTIAYNTNWGGDDPVWYGFNNKVGNCYVHALCLQRLLSAKGYATKLIWVTNKTHYWLIVKINGTWWHIDATPAGIHPTYSLMDDDMRYSTLSGRNWDRDAWPECGN